VTDAGIVDLGTFRQSYPTLRRHRSRCTDEARRGCCPAPGPCADAISWQPPIPSPEKIICIGVNYPDRNAEYKDGQDAPKYPSMFMRTPRSFVGHNAPLVRPRASAQLDYEGELVLIIGKAAGTSEATRWTISPRSRCATRARSATGCGTPSSTSPRARISIPPAALGRGSCPTATKARSRISA
jgi:hypothetical protein